MPFELTDETRRLLELIARQQQEAPTVVLGETQELPPEQPVQVNEPAQPATAQPQPVPIQNTRPAQVQPGRQTFYTANEIQKIIDAQPQQIRQQEPPDTKQRIDDAILSTTMPQAPNQHELGLLRGILANKIAYNAATTDTKRQAVNSMTNLLRNQARAAGYDLGGFGDGTNGYSLEEATNNLLSREARDLSAVLGQNGYYSMSSDQYYEQEYRNAIMRGLSPRRARKLAGNLAREYQANRVAYLDGVYNSYGRGDTALSNQIIALMGTENPMLANYYAQTNPSPKDDYNQANQMTQLMFTSQNDMEKLLARIAANQREADANRTFTLQRDKQQSDFRKDEATHEWALRYNHDVEMKKWDKLLKTEEPSMVQKIHRQYYELAIANGYNEEDAARLALVATNKYFEKQLGLNDSGKDKSSKLKLSEEQNKQYNNFQNTYYAAKKSLADEDIKALEDAVNAENARDLPPAVYQLMQDSVWILKGLKYKFLNDDNNAMACWLKVQNVQNLEDELPEYNWDWYWEKKGGKPN